MYEGEYINGKRQGYGVYSFVDGEKYEGQWFQDQQHGKGTYYFMNNNRYEGMWYTDYQQGNGTMYYYNGDVYIQETGLTINVMVREFIHGKTELNMKVTGKLIKKTVKVL